MKVGLFTAPAWPSARSSPRTSVVLPAPSGPLTVTSDTPWTARVNDAPIASICSGVPAVRSIGRIATHQSVQFIPHHCRQITGHQSDFTLLRRQTVGGAGMQPHTEPGGFAGW